VSLFLLILGCDESVKQNSKCKEKIAIENFNTFYDKFHKDSLFQISRIKFPLEGVYVDSKGEKEWSARNWTMLKIKIFDVDTSEYKVKIQRTDTTFYQKFWLDSSGFWGEYKFQSLNNKWFLIYRTEQDL